MCGAPEQTPTLPAGIDVEKETVIYGVVSKGDAPVPGAYVRLLDGTGEFTAEVVTSATGQWTLSVLHKDGKVRREVQATGPGLLQVPLAIE